MVMPLLRNHKLPEGDTRLATALLAEEEDVRIFFSRVNL